MKLDRAAVKIAPVPVLAAGIHHVEIEAGKASCASAILLARKAAGQKGQADAAAPSASVQVSACCPAASKIILGAAIGQGMQGEMFAVPDRGPARRRFDAHQNIR